MSLPVRTRLVLGFLLTLGLLAAVVLLAYRNTERLVSIGLGVPASQTVISELEGLLTGVQAAETGLRGYLLAERDDYLAPYEQAKQDVARHRARLAPLAGQVPMISRVDTLAARKIRELDAVLAAYRSGGIPAARAVVVGEAGKALLDTLRTTVSTLTDERAEAARTARRMAAQRSGEALRSIALLALSALLLLGALAIALVRFLNERIGVEASLVAERGQLEARVRERTAEVERERERATQEAARATEVAREYRTLVEQVQDYAIFRIDREGRPQSWNEGVARVLGYGEEEFLGSEVGLIFTDHDRAAGIPEKELAEAARTGVASNDRWMRRRDGRHFFAAGTTTALHDEAGELIGFTKVMRDQTTWKETEEALRRSEARYRLVARASREAIWDWNLISDQIEWNEGLEHIFGHRLDSVPADAGWWLERVHPDDRARVAGSLRNAIEGDGEFWVDEYRFERADGSYATVTDRGIVARDQQGRGYRMLGTMADFTDRRRAEEKLAQAQRIEAVGRLAGGIAHDLNNMLTTIVGYSMFLEQSLAADDEDRRADIAEIRRAADRSAALTRSLLAFARRELIRPQTLDLNEVIRDVERVLRPALGEGVKIELQLAAEDATVFADRGRLEQVVLNLAFNARDAMPAGGRLTISTQNVTLGREEARRHPGTEIIPGPYVRLIMADTGHGMEPATLSRIFEPFFTTKDVGEGTGLGLATVYGTVKQAGGFVWAYSEPDHGASFTVYLPRVGASDDVINTPVPESATPRGGSETIVIVEDEETVRTLAWRTLTAEGYDCFQAVDASAALSLLLRLDRPVHLLLTDIVMPGLGGEALARELLPRHPDMRILYTSGFTDDEVIRRGLMRAGSPFLQKPWAPEELLRRVREVLDAERTGEVERAERGTGARR